MKKTATFWFVFVLLFLSLGRTMPTTAYVATYSVTSDLTDRSYVSSVSGSQLDAALNSMRSWDNGLVGYGQTFVDVGNELGLNPLYIAAHAAWETGWGTSQIWRDKNNPFGYGAFDRCPYSCALAFTSKEDGIRTGMTYIKRDYLVSGGRYYNGANLQGMNIHYATDQNWKNGISQIMNSLQNRVGIAPVPLPPPAPTPRPTNGTAVISKTLFSLYRSDGPLYADITAVCPYSVRVYVGNTEIASMGPLNGSWQVWFDSYVPPRTEETIMVKCGSSRGYGVFRTYTVSYSENRITAKVNRSGSYRPRQ